MIFPADEVVYLSYGRLIYIPSAPTTPCPNGEDQQGDQQLQPSFDHNPRRDAQSCTNSSSVPRGSYSSAPSTSTGSSRSFRSTASAPTNNHDNSEAKDNTLNRASIIASRSYELLNQPERPKRDKKKYRTGQSAQRHTYLEVPKAAPPQPSSVSRRADRKLSYSDYAQASRPERSVKINESEANCSRYKSERKDHKSPVAVTQYSKPGDPGLCLFVCEFRVSILRTNMACCLFILT